MPPPSGPISPPSSPVSPVGAAAQAKAAWRLIPLLGAGYAVALIDRANLSFAALQMNRDLHFSESIYGFAAGIFFLSYAGCNIPANLLLLRFGARRWLAGIMIAWGVLSAATILVRTPLPFYCLRFLLGVAESGFFPGVIYTLTRWFPPQMRARAITRFYVSGPLSMMVMGSIAGTLLGLNGRLGLAGWQWLFLVEALPAILLGALILALLPDSPESARWLRPEERDWLVLHRQDGADTAAAGDGIGLARALRDPNVWFGSLYSFTALFGFYAYLLFAPIIVRKVTGYDAARVGYLLAGQYAVAALAMVTTGMLSDRKGERCFHAVIPSLAAAAGFVIAAAAHSTWVVFAGLTLIPAGGWAAQGPAWAACTACLRRGSSAVGIAFITSLGILGGFVSPNLMGRLLDLTGTYRTGFFVCAASYLASAVFVGILGRKTKA